MGMSLLYMYVVQNNIIVTFLSLQDPVTICDAHTVYVDD